MGRIKECSYCHLSCAHSDKIYPPSINPRIIMKNENYAAFLKCFFFQTENVILIVWKVSGMCYSFQKSHMASFHYRGFLYKLNHIIINNSPFHLDEYQISNKNMSKRQLNLNIWTLCQAVFNSQV